MSDGLGAALAEAIVALERAADELAPLYTSVIPMSEFDAESYASALDSLVLALVDSDMAALDRFASLRVATPEPLLDPLRTVEDALTRLDFEGAVEACRRLETALEELPVAGDGEMSQ